MNQLGVGDSKALLTELIEQTSRLENLVNAEEIEPALELLDRRLLLLAELQTLALAPEAERQQIREVARELLARENIMLAQLQMQKSSVAELLSQVISASKARSLYQQCSEE